MYQRKNLISCIQVREDDINSKDDLGEDRGHEWRDEGQEEECDRHSGLLRNGSWLATTSVQQQRQRIIKDTYNDFLIDDVLAMRVSVDQIRGKRHDNDSTGPLHEPVGQLQGTEKFCRDHFE